MPYFLRRHVVVQQDVGHLEADQASTRNASASTPGLSGHRLNAVGNRYVHRPVRQRQFLPLAWMNLVLRGFSQQIGVAAGLLDHLQAEIVADRALWSTTAGRRAGCPSPAPLPRSSTVCPGRNSPQAQRVADAAEDSVTEGGRESISCGS